MGRGVWRLGVQVRSLETLSSLPRFFILTVLQNPFLFILWKPVINSYPSYSLFNPCPWWTSPTDSSLHTSLKNRSPQIPNIPCIFLCQKRGFIYGGKLTHPCIVGRAKEIWPRHYCGVGQDAPIKWTPRYRVDYGSHCISRRNKMQVPQQLMGTHLYPKIGINRGAAP